MARRSTRTINRDAANLRSNADHMAKELIDAKAKAYGTTNTDRVNHTQLVLLRDEAKAKRNRERVAATQSKNYSKNIVAYITTDAGNTPVTKEMRELFRFRDGSMPISKGLRYEKPLSNPLVKPHFEAFKETIKAKRIKGYEPKAAPVNRANVKGRGVPNPDAYSVKRITREAMLEAIRDKHLPALKQENIEPNYSASQRAFVDMTPEQIEAIKGQVGHKSKKGK